MSLCQDTIRDRRCGNVARYRVTRLGKVLLVCGLCLHFRRADPTVKVERLKEGEQ